MQIAKNIGMSAAPFSAAPSGITITSDQTAQFTSTQDWGAGNNYGIEITFSDGQVLFVHTSEYPNAYSQTLTFTDDVQVVSVKSCNGCLFAGTQITMADGSEKNVEDIVVGDEVLSFNPETMELEPDEVTYADGSMHKISSIGYDIWKFENGYEVKTVQPHRFYNVDRQKMVYMSDWKIGEKAFTIYSERVKLISHEHVDGKFQHFTIFTKNQNYFANGLLSGNRNTSALILK